MTKIKEYNIEDEDKLLEAIMLEPETDKDWDKGWRLIDPNRATIKDIFKYEKNASIEIRLDCEHVVESYLDFGDGSPIMKIDEFSITKKDGLSIFRTHISHIYSKKKKYIVTLKTKTTCPQEVYITEKTYIRLRDLVLIKRIKAPLEMIIKKIKNFKKFMKDKGLGTDEIKLYSHIYDPGT